MSEPMALDGEWTRGAVEVIRVFADLGVPFTAADVRRMTNPPPNPNMIGTAFKIAHRRGHITPTGYTVSTDPSRRGGAHRTWTGTPNPQENAA